MILDPVLLSDVGVVEGFVGRRTLDEEGHVYTQAVGEAELIVDLPIILCIEAELTGMEDRRPAVCLRHIRVDGGEVEVRWAYFLRRTDSEEVIDPVADDILSLCILTDDAVTVFVVTVEVRDKEIAHAEELVVRPEGQGMIPEVEHEVIAQGVDVLVEFVRWRVLVDTSLDLTAVP